MGIDLDKATLMTEIDSLRRGWQAAEKQLEEARTESARLREALERICKYSRDADCGDYCSNSCMYCLGHSALASTPTTAEWLAARDTEIKASKLKETAESVKALMSSGPSAYSVARNTGIADAYILISDEAASLRAGFRGAI